MRVFERRDTIQFDLVTDEGGFATSDPNAENTTMATAATATRSTRRGQLRLIYRFDTQLASTFPAIGIFRR